MIVSLATLVLLLLLAVFVAAGMREELSIVLSQESRVRAKWMARGGLQFAIHHLKFGSDGARRKVVGSWSSNWAFRSSPATRLTSGLSGSSLAGVAGTSNILIGAASASRLSPPRATLTFKILDAASLVHANDRNPNLAAILDGLPGLSGRGSSIVSYRNGLPGQRFRASEELLAVAGMTRAVYDGVKDYLTLHAWADAKALNALGAGGAVTVSGSSPRAPVNVNTASRPVLLAVLQPVLGSSAAGFADAILGRTQGVSPAPFNTRAEFNAFATAQLSATDAALARRAFDPNRIKPAAFSTELTFHSGGIYQVEVLAEVRGFFGGSLAQKRVAAGVRVYDVLMHTLKSDFADEDLNLDGDSGDSGEGDFNGNTLLDPAAYMRTTWLDSTPIDEVDDQGPAGYSAGFSGGSDPEGRSPLPYRAVLNAVKLGFWDNFDEDVGYSRGVWRHRPYSYVTPSGTPVVAEIRQVGGWPQYGDIGSVGAASLDSGGYPGDDADNEIFANYEGSVVTNPPQPDDAYQEFFMGPPFYIKSFFGGGRHDMVNVTRWTAWPHSQPFIQAQVAPSLNAFDTANLAFYARVTNYDGRRTTATNPGDAPGVNPGDAPGRGFEDVGYVHYFRDEVNGLRTTYISNQGNKYVPRTDIPNTYEVVHIRPSDGAEVTIETDPQAETYPFLVRGPLAVERARVLIAWPPAYSEPRVEQATSFSRLKSYRFLVRKSGSSANGTFETNSGSGYAQILSLTGMDLRSVGSFSLRANASQPAWDDVRILANRGRFAKKIRVPHVYTAFPRPDLGAFTYSGLDDGSQTILKFHYVVDQNAGANPANAFVGYVAADDFTDPAQRTNAAAITALYGSGRPLLVLEPNPDAVSIGPGLPALERSDGSFIYGFEFRSLMTASTPRSPVLEDVTLTIVGPTEFLSWRE